MNNFFILKKKWIALTGIGITSFLGCIDFTIVNTALPAIKNDLHATISQLQWIINIFILALSSFMVIMSRIADIYGRRRIFYTGVIIFATASTLAGFANTIHGLIFWRLIQGISCSIIYTASGALVANIFDVDERGRAMGLFFAIAFTGLAAGPVAGGFIVGALGWRWIFFVNIPVVVISLAMCLYSVPESYNTSNGRKIDFWGMLLLMLGIATLVLALNEANIWGWLSLKTLSLLIFAIIMLLLLYYVEAKVNSPIINFSFFKNSGFLSGITANFFLAFFYCLAFFLMPLYLSNIRGESDYQIGLMLLFTTATVALVSPIAGKITDRKGPKKPLIYGFIFFVISAVIQATFTTNTSLVVIILAFIIMGIAWGIIAGPSTVVALNALPASNEAAVMGTSWTFHNIGGSIGLSLGVAVYHIALLKFNNSFIAGYCSAMLLLTMMSILALLILLRNFANKI